MDDQFDFGTYTPSIGVNSRSGSMKKLTRKTDKSQQPNDKKSHKQSNDLDQLDDLLNNDIIPKKKDTSLNKNNSLNPPAKKMHDSVDSFFDQPSTNLNVTSKININQKKQIPSNNLDFARTSINFKPTQTYYNQLIEQDNKYGSNFSKGIRQRSKSPTTNHIKLPQQNNIFKEQNISMRNMRPPLKRKESASGINTGFADKYQNQNLSLGLNISEQKKQIKPSDTMKLNLTTDFDQKPSKSMNLGRRGSMDNKSQKRFETGLTLLGEEKNQKVYGAISHLNILDKSQKVDTLNQPKLKMGISQMQIGKSIMINEKNSNIYHQNSNEMNQSMNPQFKSIIDSNYSFQKTQAKLTEPPKLATQMNTIKQQSNNFYDYQKQLQHLKTTYQKQLLYLQQALDKQISINQQTRDRLIKESNNLIDQERKRSNRVHDQEIKRIKQINEWQKKKMQDSYKYQIQNLKSSILQYQNASSNHIKPNSFQSLNDQNKYKRQIQRLQEQLNLQRKLLIDRQNHLMKRQLEIQERQSQFNARKRRQQQNFRNHQILLLQKQTKAKSSILNQKKCVTQQKQKMAMQIANMELQLIKKKQKLELLIKQVQMQKQAVQNQRHQVRNLNQQMMARYKQKMDQLGVERQRVNNLQADLIRKLRIIQLKSKQDHPGNQTLNNINHSNSKQNNWTKQRPLSSAAQKQSKLNQTSQRYNKVQNAVNKTFTNKMHKTFALHPQNHSKQQFKLQNYLMSMNKYQKARYNNFI